MKLLDDLEKIVMSGQLNQAIKLIKNVKLRQLHRSDYWRLANLAQRCGLPMYALKILYRLVNGELSEISPPSNRELLEYGFCLLMVGAPRESMNVFDRIDSSTENQVFLYQSYANITEWNYSKSTESLNKFIQNYADKNPYQLFVANLNLALSQFYTGYDEKALNTLNELVIQLDESKHNFLLANSYELLGQIMIENNEYKEATINLNKAKEILKGQNGVFNILIAKSMATLRAIQEGFSSATADFKRVRDEAIKCRQWEIARQIDFSCATFSKNSKDFFNIYFSTPHENYRKYMLNKYNLSQEIPASFQIHSPFRERRKDKSVFNLSFGGLNGQESIFQPGQVEHRLIAALSKDLYKPRRVATLHSDVYPEDYFNPLSSPLKIYQTVRRVRKKLSSYKIPIEIIELDGSYCLSTIDDSKIEVQLETAVKSPLDFRILHLREKYKFQKFTAKEAAVSLDLSLRSTNYLIKEELGQSIEKIGSGPKTKYKFVS